MNVLRHHPAVNASLVSPAVVPSRRAAHRGLPAAFFEATAERILYRLTLWWADSSTRSGVREEVVKFTNPRKLRDLLARIAATPDRELRRFSIRAMVRPRWYEVGGDFIAWRAAEAERRSQARRGAR